GSSVPLAGCLALQFLEPIHNYVHLQCRRLLLISLDHDEMLAIGGDVVVVAGLPVSALEDKSRGVGLESGLCLDGHSHQFIAVPIEDFTPVPRPQRMAATIR